MSGPPSFTPSQPPPAPGSRPGGLSAAEHEKAMQQQRQQQRLRALERERKLAAVENRSVPPHYLTDEAWAEFLDRRSATWREEHARVVEWWLRSPSAFRAVTDDARLLGVLGSVRRAHGCCAITMGHSCSLSDVGNVVAIGWSTQILFYIYYQSIMLTSLDRFRPLPSEWANAKARSDYFAVSEASTPFTQAMQQANFQRFLAYRQLEQNNGSIIDHEAHAATQIHEIWTACFPADLATEDMEFIEKQEGPFQLPRDHGCNKKRQPDAHEILYGAYRRSHGWALVEDGVTGYYQNRLVRRMVYVFLWESEEARRSYRSEAFWRTTTRHGRVLDRPTDAFLCGLEELGMLGLEKWDYRLDESVSIN